MSRSGLRRLPRRRQRIQLMREMRRKSVGVARFREYAADPATGYLFAWSIDLIRVCVPLRFESTAATEVRAVSTRRRDRKHHQEALAVALVSNQITLSKAA